MPIFDIESFVYAKVSGDVKVFNEDIYTTGEYVDSPAKFPAVSIIEMSNSVLEKMSTTNIENAASVMYEVNIYTNRIGYRKSDAKDILQVVDNAMNELGFVRIMAQPTPNIADATIYRITARYRGVVVPEYGVDGTVYRIYTN